MSGCSVEVTRLWKSLCIYTQAPDGVFLLPPRTKDTPRRSPKASLDDATTPLDLLFQIDMTHSEDVTLLWERKSVTKPLLTLGTMGRNPGADFFRFGQSRTKL